MDDVLILTGPTGSGKTALGIALAQRLGAEIVAMDSMTLYRGLDIGTAKPTAAERQQVPHHLLDVLDPWESASVAWWLERARACCQDIRARGQRVLFVGGTALYLKALLYGLFDGPPARPEVRQRLEAEATEHGREALHQRLAAVDPPTAARLHPNDLRRVVRALEVWELTGQPISQWQQQWAESSGQWPVAGGQHSSASPLASHDSSAAAGGSPTTGHRAPATGHWPSATALWLDLPRAELHDRINRRVLRMIDDGLVEEVRALRQLPRPLSREAAQALGYKELFAHLDGQATLEEAIARIQARTRNFAKRQITWFRHIPQCLRATEELTFRLWAS